MAPRRKSIQTSRRSLNNVCYKENNYLCCLNDYQTRVRRRESLRYARSHAVSSNRWIVQDVMISWPAYPLWFVFKKSLCILLHGNFPNSIFASSIDDLDSFVKLATRPKNVFDERVIWTNRLCLMDLRGFTRHPVFLYFKKLRYKIIIVQN